MSHIDHVLGKWGKLSPDIIMSKSATLMNINVPHDNLELLSQNRMT